MEDIDIIIYLAIAGIILPYFLPLIFLIVIIVEKSKLSKIADIQEFKEKIKMLVKNRKLSAIKKWFKPGDAFTTIEIINRLVQEKEKLNKGIRRFSIALFVLFFGVYVSLVENIGNYYIKVKIGYEIPLTFPKVETLTLIALSAWIAGVFCLKLFLYRINMYLKKIKELEDNTG